MKKIIVAYIIFLMFMVVFSYLFIDPNLIYLKNFYTGIALTNRLFVSILYLLCIVVFFFFYVLFFKLLKENKLTNRHIIILIVVTALIMLFSYPAMLSYDVFNYMTTSKVAFLYKENPYIIMPINFIGEPFLQFTRAANKIALYGPFWIILTSVPYYLSFGNFFGMLLGFKIINTICYLCMPFIIWKLSGKIQSVLFFALNPLVIIETLLSSHNDILMMLLALCAFTLLFTKKYIFSIILLLMSVLVKYATLVLLPVYLYALIIMIKNKKINKIKIFYYSAISMYAAFLIAPIREEIYPWYAIWIITFVSLFISKKVITYFIIVLSFCFMLTYIPYMYTGMYTKFIPIFKILLGGLIPILTVFCGVLYKKVWSKRFQLSLL